MLNDLRKEFDIRLRNLVKRPTIFFIVRVQNDIADALPMLIRDPVQLRKLPAQFVQLRWVELADLFAGFRVQNYMLYLPGSFWVLTMP